VRFLLHKTPFYIFNLKHCYNKNHKTNNANLLYFKLHNYNKLLSLKNQLKIFSLKKEKEILGYEIYNKK